ncbi:MULTISPECIES: peptide IlvX [Enterobacteriaceae]|nr:MULTISPECIES: peptide IlvX [Enterobacteriaceae]MCR4460031.1 peptide IlvX [Pseudescherichia sp. L3]MDU5455147.1 peptide IlvX [Pseudescherichia vulneris]WPO97334.1 peptide IlvX [Buttiauxella sp. HR94]
MRCSTKFCFSRFTTGN